MPARVLVVAAQPAIQLQLGNMLRLDGHEIMVCSDGTEGWRRWSNDRPDLVAMDIDLPDIDGLHVVTTIRQSEAPGFHTPVMLFGSSVDIDSKVRATCRRR